MEIYYHSALLEPLVLTVTACLCANTADLGVWMDAGRRAIERAWTTDATFAVTLTGSLVESGWKVVNQFALPRFLSESLQYLEQSQTGGDDGELPIRIQILRVLAELAKNGSLKDTDDAWRTRFAVWIQAWLSDFQLNDLSVCITIAEVVRFLTT